MEDKRKETRDNRTHSGRNSRKSSGRKFYDDISSSECSDCQIRNLKERGLRKLSSSASHKSLRGSKHGETESESDGSYDRNMSAHYRRHTQKKSNSKSRQIGLRGEHSDSSMSDYRNGKQLINADANKTMKFGYDICDIKHFKSRIRKENNTSDESRSKKSLSSRKLRSKDNLIRDTIERILKGDTSSGEESSSEEPVHSFSSDGIKEPLKPKKTGKNIRTGSKIVDSDDWNASVSSLNNGLVSESLQHSKHGKQYKKSGTFPQYDGKKIKDLRACKTDDEGCEDSVDSAESEKAYQMDLRSFSKSSRSIRDENKYNYLSENAVVSDLENCKLTMEAINLHEEIEELFNKLDSHESSDSVVVSQDGKFRDKVLKSILKKQINLPTSTDVINIDKSCKNDEKDTLKEFCDAQVLTNETARREEINRLERFTLGLEGEETEFQSSNQTDNTKIKKNGISWDITESYLKNEERKILAERKRAEMLKILNSGPENTGPTLRDHYNKWIARKNAINPSNIKGVTCGPVSWKENTSQQQKRLQYDVLPHHKKDTSTLQPKISMGHQNCNFHKTSTTNGGQETFRAEPSCYLLTHKPCSNVYSRESATPPSSKVKQKRDAGVQEIFIKGRFDPRTGFIKISNGLSNNSDNIMVSDHIDSLNSHVISSKQNHVGVDTEVSMTGQTQAKASDDTKPTSKYAETTLDHNGDDHPFTHGTNNEAEYPIDNRSHEVADGDDHHQEEDDASEYREECELTEYDLKRYYEEYENDEYYQYGNPMKLAAPLPVFPQSNSTVSDIAGFTNKGRLFSVHPNSHQNLPSGTRFYEGKNREHACCRHHQRRPKEHHHHHYHYCLRDQTGHICRHRRHCNKHRHHYHSCRHHSHTCSKHIHHSRRASAASENASTNEALDERCDKKLDESYDSFSSLGAHAEVHLKDVKEDEELQKQGEEAPSYRQEHGVEVPKSLLGVNPVATKPNCEVLCTNVNVPIFQRRVQCRQKSQSTYGTPKGCNSREIESLSMVDDPGKFKVPRKVGERFAPKAYNPPEMQSRRQNSSPCTYKTRLIYVD